MAVYLGTIGTSVFFAYITVHGYGLEKLGSRRSWFVFQCLMFLSFLPPTVVSAIRYDVGADYMNYTSIFKRGFYRNDEAAFGLLIKALRVFSDNPQWLFVVTSIFICASYFRWIYKESVDPVFSILLFFINFDYFKSMNVIRQYMAISVVLMTIPYIKKRDWKKALLVTAFAIVIHRSAIFFFPVYLLYAIEIPPLIGFAAFVGTLVLANPIKSIVYSVLTRMGMYTSYFSVQAYNDPNDYSYWLNIGIFLCFFLLLAYEYRKVKSTPNLKLMYVATLMGLIISAATSAIPEVAERITLYMNAILILYTPEATRALGKKKYTCFFNRAIFASYTAIMIIKLTMNIAGVLPYQTI